VCCQAYWLDLNKFKKINFNAIQKDTCSAANAFAAEIKKKL